MEFFSGIKKAYDHVESELNAAVASPKPAEDSAADQPADQSSSSLVSVIENDGMSQLRWSN